MRIIIHEARNLRYTEGIFGTVKGERMECFVVIACGNNPVKTTRSEKVPLNNKHKPVIWNEPVDIEVRSSDSVIIMQVMDYDKGGSDDLVGSAEVPLTEIFTTSVRWRFGWEAVSTPTPVPKEFKMLYRGDYGGSIWCSFYLTKPGVRLPTVLAHMVMPDDPESDTLLGHSQMATRG